MARAAVSSPSLDKKDQRRKQILDAAFECLIRFGYSKVTINDIANQADLSRPLIYLQFKSKEEIFINMFSDIFDAQVGRVAAVIASEKAPRAKAVDIFGIVILELWPKLIGSSEGSDLFDATQLLFPRIGKKYRARLAATLAQVVGDEQSAELLILAVKGLCYDRPSAALLKKRIALLVERFVP